MRVLRPLLKMLIIFILLYTGVTIWYGRITNQLLAVPEAVTETVTETEVEKVMETVESLPPVEKEPEALQNGPDYGIILSRDIFAPKLDPDAGKKEEIKTVELKETALRLALLGTVSGNESDARAIIVDEKKKQQDIYQIGDAVQQAVIRAIERGKVILEVDGRREVLLINDVKNEGGSVTTATALPRPSVRRQTAPRPSIARPQPRVNVRRASLNPPQTAGLDEEIVNGEDDLLEEPTEPEEPIGEEEGFFEEPVEPVEQIAEAEEDLLQELAGAEEVFVEGEEDLSPEDVVEEISESPEDAADEPDQ